MRAVPVAVLLSASASSPWFSASTMTENPIAAAELAKWINTADEPALKLATEQFLFPAYEPILTDPAFIDQESEFYGGEQDPATLELLREQAQD